EVDYSKGGTGASDGAMLSAGPFTPGTPSANQVKRAADAFGAPGEDNGVSLGFSAANEIPKDDAPRSSANSPDGLLFQVSFDGDRLKGPALQIALSHVGTHIADLRSPEGGIPNLILYGVEFRAWQTSVLSAVATMTKTLMLPGGYVIYDKSWPGSDLGRDADTAIAKFLMNWAGITNSSEP
ncbi:MAG: hypothetical protein ACRD4Y_02310, partial [Candidatus Acidiferrales bacterium]